MSRKESDPGILAADRAREELYATLGRLRERLDYAARFDRAADRAKARIADAKQEKPAVFALGVAAVAASAGLIVWGIARKFLVK